MADFKTMEGKFLALSIREQTLILLTGLVAIVMVLFSTVIDANVTDIKLLTKQNQQMRSSSQILSTTIHELQLSLQQDPDVLVKQMIAEHQQKLASIDQDLLTLTSELINPIEMRNALTKLLKLERGVRLLSFEVIPASAINLQQSATDLASEATAPVTQGRAVVDAQTAQVDSLALYRHGIKLKLKGNFFQLRNYLAQLEQLPWKFFWQQFDYQLVQYPNAELEIEMYSLSTKQEFIGV